MSTIAGQKQIKNHKRVGSTGTTGEDSYSSDDEDNFEMENGDVTIRDHVNMFTDRPEYGYSAISTISDKVRGINIGDRNRYVCKIVFFNKTDTIRA